MTVQLCGWMGSDLVLFLGLVLSSAGLTGKGRQQWCHLCVGMVTTGGTWEVIATQPTPMLKHPQNLLKHPQPKS